MQVASICNVLCVSGEHSPYSNVKLYVNDPQIGNEILDQISAACSANSTLHKIYASNFGANKFPLNPILDFDLPNPYVKTYSPDLKAFHIPVRHGISSNSMYRDGISGILIKIARLSTEVYWNEDIDASPFNSCFLLEIHYAPQFLMRGYRFLNATHKQLCQLKKEKHSKVSLQSISNKLARQIITEIVKRSQGGDSYPYLSEHDIPKPVKGFSNSKIKQSRPWNGKRDRVDQSNGFIKLHGTEEKVNEVGYVDVIS